MATKYELFIEKCEKVWDKMNLTEKDRNIIIEDLKNTWWRFNMPISAIREEHIRNATLGFLGKYYKEILR